jgi:hypothetical protein
MIAKKISWIKTNANSKAKSNLMIKTKMMKKALMRFKIEFLILKTKVKIKLLKNSTKEAHTKIIQLKKNKGQSECCLRNNSV